MFDKILTQNFTHDRPLIAEKNNLRSDYAVAFSKDRELFRAFINKYKREEVLDLACGRGQAVEQMRALGIKAYGVDPHPEASRDIAESLIEKLDTHPMFLDKKFELVMSCYGFGVYATDRNDPLTQIRHQFKAIASVMKEGSMLIFNTTGGSDNIYENYNGTAAPMNTLFEIRYIDNPAPDDDDLCRFPLLELAIEAGFVQVWEPDEMPEINNPLVVKLKYIGKLN